MTTFSYDGAVIQFDTITTTGTYDITAAGGQGGNNADIGEAGGLAATSGGVIFLQSGAVLVIVVGGAGGNECVRWWGWRRPRLCHRDQQRFRHR